MYKNDLERTYIDTRSAEKLKGSRILVTGATGLIGRYLVDFLGYCNENKGFACEVFAACREEKKFRECFGRCAEKQSIHFTEYDMAQPIRWDFPVDYIIHCAGNAYPAAFVSQPLETLMHPVIGTEQLLRYVRYTGVKRMVLISSGEIYGQTAGTDAWSEGMGGSIDIMNPRSCYPIGKCAAEHLCALFYKQYGTESVVARLCHTYGPTASQKDNRAAQAFIRDVVKGRNIIMKSSGKQKRSWCYAADAASGIFSLLSVGQAGEAYNVAATVSRGSIREFAELAAKLGGQAVEFRQPCKEEREGFNPMDAAVLSSEKIETLGWCGHYTLHEGIGHTIDIMRGRAKLG